MNENNKLNELENITNRIIKNINTIIDSAKTSELDTYLKDMNKNLAEQKRLRSETGIDKNTSDTKQIQSIKKSLAHQDRILKDFSHLQETDLDNINKSLDITYKTGKISNQKTTQVEIQNRMTSKQIFDDTKLSRSDADMGSAMWWLAVKSGKEGGKTAAEIMQKSGLLWVSWLGTGILAGIEAYETALATITDITELTKKMGDRMQSIASATDESVRSTIQSLGLVTDKVFGTETQVDKVVENLLDSGRYMVQQLGLPFDPVKMSEFQKAYTELSKTTVAFHETDMASLAQMQLIFDLSAQESAKFTGMFINMGGSVNDVARFFSELMETATNAGVNAKDIIKDMEGYFNATNLYRFRGGVQDMSKIMTYAKRIKIDLGGMFKLMDKVSEPEEAVDLAAQLSALDTAFLGLDPIDLLGAAMTDVERFTGMITGPLIENVEKYYDEQKGQLTQFGKNFSTSFLKLEGINNVFKSEVEFTQFLMKQGKEKTVREQIMSTIGGYREWGLLTSEEQDGLIAVLSSQYQKDSKGLKVTTTGQYIGEMSAEDMRSLIKSTDKTKSALENIQTAAVGTVSVKDQIQTNKMLVESMMSNIDAINAVNQILMDGELREQLKFIGNTIMDIGLETYTNAMFKQMEVMQMLGLDSKEAYMYSDLLQDSGELFASGIIALIEMIPKISLGYIDLDKSFDQTDNTTTSNTFRPSTTKSKGGVIDQKQMLYSNSNNSISKAKPRMTSGSVSAKKLGSLLTSFNTNKFGPGIIGTRGAGVTNVVVTGSLKNYINDEYVGLISGDKILSILEKQIT